MAVNRTADYDEPVPAERPARPPVRDEIDDIKEEVRQLNDMIRSLSDRLSMHDKRITSVQLDIGS